MRSIAVVRPSWPALVAVALVAALVFSAAARRYAQDFLLLFRERPFSVVQIDAGVFQSGLGLLGILPEQAVRIEYELAPKVSRFEPGDVETRGKLPRNPGGLTVRPQRLMWGPVEGRLTLNLGPLGGLGGPNQSLPATQAGEGQLSFKLARAPVVLYAQGAAAAAFLEGKLPQDAGPYLLYGESSHPEVGASGAFDIAAAAEMISETRMLPPRFRGQMRVIADWLRFLLPAGTVEGNSDPPPPVLVEGLGDAAIVIWTGRDTVKLLLGNLGSEALLELAKRIG